MQFISGVLAVLVLAGHALAADLVISFFGSNVTAQELMAFPQGRYMQGCEPICTKVNTTIQSCGLEGSCLCTNTTALDLQTCEQCLFNNLVATGIDADRRVGANAALAGFSEGCGKQNITLEKIGLTIPAGEPQNGIILNTPATAVVVGFGGLLGGGALWIMSNL